MPDRRSRSGGRIRARGLWIALPLALVFVAGACLVLLPGTVLTRGRPATGPSPAVAAAPVGVPDRLRIPAIGLDARVESVGVTAQGTMGVPTDPRDVGWYAPGVRPGEPGDAVMDGFMEWSSGPAAFADLSRLRAGDEVDVDLSDERRLIFRVDRLARFPFNQSLPGLFERGGSPRLSLVTSSSRWNGTGYEDRVEVDARLVSTTRTTPTPAPTTPGPAPSGSRPPARSR
ncbi:MAG TPA: class F sortase [Candidatus Dormibacteraeota bacterium]|nr:class F sortase [Candidatus Dormibacteraeota bacterium]